MSARELILQSPMTRLRAVEESTGSSRVVIFIEAGVGNSLSVNLDRTQQHMLMMWLRERLER